MHIFSNGFAVKSLNTRIIVVEQHHKSVRDPTYYGAWITDYRSWYYVSVQWPISPCVPVGRAGSPLGGLEPMHNPSWVGNRRVLIAWNFVARSMGCLWVSFELPCSLVRLPFAKT